MRLSEIKGDAALDTLADLIDPICEICSDKTLRALLRVDKLGAIKSALKFHKKSVIAIMAALEGVPAEKYEVNLISLPVKMLEILNDPDVTRLFTSAEPTAEKKPSGSASTKADSKA